MSNVAERFQALARQDEDILEDIMREAYTELLANAAPFSVVDGGAHKGLHTFPLAALPGCRRVYAVEANGELAAALEREAQGAAGASIEVVAAALQEDAARESVTFMRSDSHSGRSGISSIFQKDPEVSFSNITVPATTIDKMAADRRHPVRFVKLDLEGGEWNAVRGGGEVMAKDRPVFVMEHSVYSPEINGYGRQDYLALFEQRGYRPITFAGEPMNADNMFYLWYVWAAPKEQAEDIQGRLRRHAEHSTRNR